MGHDSDLEWLYRLTGWAAGYAANDILEAVLFASDAAQVAFSEA
jgi:hypothetical protein